MCTAEYITILEFLFVESAVNADVTRSIPVISTHFAASVLVVFKNTNKAAFNKSKQFFFF